MQRSHVPPAGSRGMAPRMSSGHTPSWRVSRPWRWTSLVFVLALLGSATFQQPQAAPADGASFDERIDVRLVEISLLARDRHGAPIADLRPADLEVRVRGEARDVALLLPRVRAAEGAGGSGGRIVLQDAEAAPGPGASAPARWMVFAVDIARSEPDEVEQAWRAVEDFLRRDLQPADQVAVATLTDTLHLEQAFTADRSALLAAVTRGRSRSVSTPSRHVRLRQLLLLARDCQRRMTGSGRFAPGAECSIAAAREFVRESKVSSRAFSQAFDLLGRVLAGVDGESSIYLFSGGALSRPEDVAAEAIESVAGDNVQIRDLRHQIARDSRPQTWLSEAARVASGAGAVLFAIDGSRPGLGDLGASSRLGLRRTASPQSTAWRQARGDLETVAEQTGGLFVGSGDVGADLTKALDAQRGAYVLGLYLEAGDPADTDLDIRSRRRGVELGWSRDPRFPRPSPGDRASAGSPGLASLVVEPGDQEPVGGRRRQAFKLAFRPEAFASRPLANGALAFHSTVHLRLESAEGHSVDQQFRLLSPVAAPGTRPVLSGFVDLECDAAPCDAVTLWALVRDPTGGQRVELEAEIPAGPDRWAEVADGPEP